MSAADLETSMLMLPMRDGIRLATDVRMPAGEPLGAVLVRTPYGRAMAGPSHNSALLGLLLEAGVALVLQDCRGTGGSEGTFTPLVAERPDGADTLDWIVAQPWGARVVMLGDSYLGFTQFAAAVTAHPALVGIIPMNTAADVYAHWAYSPAGALSLENSDRYAHMVALHGSGPRPGPTAPADSATLRDPLGRADALNPAVPWYRDWLAHPTRDAYWNAIDFTRGFADVSAAALHIGGWYDFFSDATTSDFAALAAGIPGQHLIMGPWTHVDTSGRFEQHDFGAASSAVAIGLDELRRDFVTDLLTGRAVDAPAVRYFAMGANEWRSATSWPPEGVAEHTWAFGIDDALFDAEPPGAQGVRVISIDPADPVPTRGGRLLTPGDSWSTAGPEDQSTLHRRDDVLTFTSAPLPTDTEIAGPIRVRLTASTSAADADLAVTLSDVHPDGRALLLSEGIARLSHRAGPNRAEPVVSGAPYVLDVDASVTANVFRAGHRIRIAVAPSNFPRWALNPSIYGSTSPATITLYLDGCTATLPSRSR